MASNMKEQYRPRTTLQRLGYLVEECGEVQAALGKTIRWGLDSYNPELPPEERETNREWILRELVDLKRAIAMVEDNLRNSASLAINNEYEFERVRKHAERAGLIRDGEEG